MKYYKRLYTSNSGIKFLFENETEKKEFQNKIKKSWKNP